MIMCSSSAASTSSHHRCSRLATTILGSVTRPILKDLLTLLQLLGSLTQRDRHERLGQDVDVTVTARLDLAIFDAADIAKVGSFYAEITGWDVVRNDSERFGVRTPDGQEIEFQHAPNHVAPRWPGQEHPQQFHLDLQTEDPQA